MWILNKFKRLVINKVQQDATIYVILVKNAFGKRSLLIALSLSAIIVLVFLTF
jgi:hypothetical protein